MHAARLCRGSPVITGILQKNTVTETFSISCPLVLSLVSETEWIGSMIDHDRLLPVWLSF